MTGMLVCAKGGLKLHGCTQKAEKAKEKQQTG